MRSACTTLSGSLVYRSPPPVYKAGRSAPEWFTRMVEPTQPEQELDDRGGPHRDRARRLARDPGCLGRPEPAGVAAARIPAGGEPGRVLPARALAAAGANDPVRPVADGAGTLRRAPARLRPARVRLDRPDLQPHGRCAGGEPRGEPAARAGGQAVQRRHHHPRSAGQHLVLEPGRGAPARLPGGGDRRAQSARLLTPPDLEVGARRQPGHHPRRRR